MEFWVVNCEGTFVELLFILLQFCFFFAGFLVLFGGHEKLPRSQ